MPRNSVYILTGEINSGKTTAIANWASGKADVFGILTPKTFGSRVFQNIGTGEQFEMEAGADETNVSQIGRYTFSDYAFYKASAILREALVRPHGWLVVDEVGPLELRQKGFYEVVEQIVANENAALKKLLVIRDSLVKEITSFFKISEYTVVSLPLNIE